MFLPVVCDLSFADQLSANIPQTAHTEGLAVAVVVKLPFVVQLAGFVLFNLAVR